MRGVLLGLLLISVPCLAQTSEAESLSKVATSALQQKLQGGSSFSSNDLLQQILQETGLSKPEINVRLLGLLDSLDHQRRQESEIWKNLIAVGGDEISPKKADRFLQELIKSARKTLQKSGNYSSQSILEQAAKKAKIVPFQANAFLLRILNAGSDSDSSVTHSKRLLDKVGLLVKTRSTYRIVISDGPRMIFEKVLGKNPDDSLVKEKLSDFHKKALPFLIQELPKSDYVKWAVEEPTSLLQPDYRFYVEISELLYPPGAHVYIPYISALGFVVNVVLQSMDGGKTGSYIYNQTLSITYDFSVEEDERIRDLRLLDKCYEKIAQETAKALDAFLSEQRK